MTFIPANFFGTDVSAIYHVGYVVENLNDGRWVNSARQLALVSWIIS